MLHVMVFLLQEPLSDMERGETVSRAALSIMLLLIDLSGHTHCQLLVALGVAIYCSLPLSLYGYGLQ